jgi:alpha-1,2-mannosyltransferase
MKSAAPNLIETNALQLTAALLVAFALAFFVYYGIDTTRDPVFAIDFSPYYVAGQLLAEGRAAELIPLPTDGLMTSSSPPFVANFQRYFFPDSKSGTGWIYLPGYAWLFRPLAGLEFPVAARLWLLINALLSAGAVALIAWARPWPGDARYRRWRLAWIIFFGLTFQPVLDNMWHGNTSALILFVFCLSYLLLRRGRNGLAGLALGLIVMLKFYPALIVLYFVWRRNWAYVAGALAGAAALVGLSWLTVGTENLLRYAGLLIAEMEAGGVAAFNNQSLTGFLLHALTQGNVNGWEDMTVPLFVTVLRYAAILALVGAAVWVMRRRPEQVDAPDAAQDFDLTLIIGLMLIIAPATWYHYYVWLLLPVIIVFDSLWLRPTGQWRLAAFAVAYGLIVVQGISGVRAFAPQAIQDVWLLRVLLSSSFFGAVLLFGLTLRLRAGLRVRL